MSLFVEISIFRCGVKDREWEDYVIHPSGGWKKNDLTYRIDDYPSRISRSETETVIKRAFDMWAEVTPLTLTQTRNYNADIHIRFIEWCIYLQNWMTVQRKIEIIMTSDLKLWKCILQVCKLWSWRLKFFWWSWRSSCTCIFSNIWWWCTFWWLWAMGYRWGIIRIESTI